MTKFWLCGQYFIPTFFYWPTNFTDSFSFFFLTAKIFCQFSGFLFSVLRRKMPKNEHTKAGLRIILKSMISVRMAILEDWIKHDSCNTVLKKLKGERIFKLMSSFVNDTLRKISVTAKNTVISPNLLVWKFCGKVQFPLSFRRFARNSEELCLSTKFSHQEIRWNYGIFRSDRYGYKYNGKQSENNGEEGVDGEES